VLSSISGRRRAGAVVGAGVLLAGVVVVTCARRAGVLVVRVIEGCEVDAGGGCGVVVRVTVGVGFGESLTRGVGARAIEGDDVRLEREMLVAPAAAAASIASGGPMCCIDAAGLRVGRGVARETAAAAAALERCNSARALDGVVSVRLTVPLESERPGRLALVRAPEPAEAVDVSTGELAPPSAAPLAVAREARGRKLAMERAATGKRRRYWRMNGRTGSFSTEPEASVARGFQSARISGPERGRPYSPLRALRATGTVRADV